MLCRGLLKKGLYMGLYRHHGKENGKHTFLQPPSSETTRLGVTFEGCSESVPRNEDVESALSLEHSQRCFKGSKE